jgi:pyruvate, orthophosphate dikinase
MVKERLISKEESVRRVEPQALVQLLAPIFDAVEKKHAVAKGKLLAKGLNAGPGAACGRAVFNADEVAAEAKKGPVVLVRMETSPEDIHGMAVAKGILTSRGGMTSHAALVARGMGKPCIVGCAAVEIDYARKVMRIGKRSYKQGEFLSIDGTTGEVIEGQLKTYPSEVVQVLIDGSMKVRDSMTFRYFEKILEWADEIRRLGVRCNADIPRDAAAGRKFGAEGIGLCRTEHMFFDPVRLEAMRMMILSETPEQREKALEKILPYQKSDFMGLFKELSGLPITIRLLDPPLHEFIPHQEKEMKKLAKKMKMKLSEVKARANQLKEFNPMLGHRGCRLGISYPEIYDLQVRAIMEAACEVARATKKKPLVEIMVPIVGHKKELEIVRERAEKIVQETMKKYKLKLDYKIGTMIEIPRAAITADKVAEVAEFFSFGTNDLTQTTLGVSRDDAGSFLPLYTQLKIYPTDPFEAIDQEGVGQMMEIAVKKGRTTRPKLKIGICGEHGGEPSSVEFCHRINLDYVSCSPYRVPIARMAAAHAVLKEKGEAKDKD